MSFKKVGYFMEKEMATHSSVLAWRIPRMGEPGGLPSMGSQSRTRLSDFTYSDGKASACNVGDPGSICGLGRSPGEENGNPLQYSCLENPMGRGVWRATIHGVTKNRTQLSD